MLCASVLLDRTEEIFCVIPPLVCSSTLTLSRCIQLPWWCWRKMSFFRRCASTWSPKSETVLSCASLQNSELDKNRIFVSTAEIDTFFSNICFRVKEEVFWRNYFYRVSLIKQSAQLTALAAKHSAMLPELKKTSANLEAVHQQGWVIVWLFNMDIVLLVGLSPFRITHKKEMTEIIPSFTVISSTVKGLFIMDIKLQHRKNKQISGA